MFIDIHRHSAEKGGADVVLRNLFHRQTKEIAEEQYCSLGLHPWHVSQKSYEKNLQKVDDSARCENVLAIGEAGIDKVIDTDIELQANVFEHQLQLALKLNKPMIIHCVRAYNELLKIRKESKHRQAWIFHWYNASQQMAKDLVSKGCYLSFGHLLFVEQSKAYKSFVELPPENIFLETDDADVTIKEVYERAAQIKEISVAELQLIQKQNFENCFGKKLA